jgi:hypothetical protein
MCSQICCHLSGFSVSGHIVQHVCILRRTSCLWRIDIVLFLGFLCRYLKDYDYYQKCVLEREREEKPLLKRGRHNSGCLCFSGGKSRREERGTLLVGSSGGGTTIPGNSSGGVGEGGGAGTVWQRCTGHRSAGPLALVLLVAVLTGAVGAATVMLQILAAWWRPMPTAICLMLQVLLVAVVKYVSFVWQ